ncbi:zymogen granule membrane protein 16-like [Megalops cyprinoides]|uniref:zymogen granule membrane protein 16-like n=1 Tax=Megalops cyprinoides TaxID=118141 RepID=UPI0018647882|nr:zymogen granule membrane protein 16-like [Megalops cyprinoides]
MLSILVLCLCLLVSVRASSLPQYYSYSSSVGSGSGSPYATTGEGRITAVRVWDSSYIRGFQFRYDYAWTPVIGNTYGTELEMMLFEGEAIIQVSGKYQHYIESLMFVTNRGRSLIAGAPSGWSFNFYPTHSGSELRLLSGRVHGGITSIGAHWGMVYSMENATMHT